ncbi:pseudogene [Sorangium cellulosum So ce56]|nr:pseudogene [Sorangium cellulosum So ce56]
MALPLALAAAAPAACAPRGAASPLPADAPLPAAFSAALEAEITSSAAAAPYLDALDRAVGAPSEGGALATVIASLDALVFGAGTAGGPDPDAAAIAFRSREALPEVARRLQRAWAFADVDGRGAPEMPFVRGALASALHRIALFVGDEAAAATWSARRGCAGEAALVGPLDAAPLHGLARPSPVSSAPGAPLARAYPGLAPFAQSASPIVVRADACAIDIDAVSALQGTRAVVVDLHNPIAQRVSLALASSSAAVLEVGGVPALQRDYAAGGAQVTRLATVEAQPGTLRVVVRVAQKGDGDAIELTAWGENGLPLRARAPRPGAAATASASRPAAVSLAPAPASRGAADQRPGAASVEVAAAALLALGDARAAEHLLDPDGDGGLRQSDARPPASAPPPATAAPRSPRLDLLYARAIRRVGDLPEAEVVERTRAAVDRVLAAWPASWEARLYKAELAERRGGRGEGTMDALRELGVRVAPPGPAGPSAPAVADADRMVLAELAVVARRANVTDVAEAAYAKLAAAAPGSTLLAVVDDRIHGRAGVDAVKAACEGGLDRSSAACLGALLDASDRDAVLAEIKRLRRLRRAPDALREVELRERVARGDLRGALAVYDAMPPGQRAMLEALGLAAGRGDARAVRGRLARDRATARDTPAGIGPITRALGLAPDPAPALEAEGRKLVLEDQKKAFLPGAATRGAPPRRAVHDLARRARPLRHIRPPPRLRHHGRGPGRGHLRPAHRGPRHAAPPAPPHPQARRPHPRARRGVERRAGPERPLPARAGRLHRAGHRGPRAAGRRRPARHRHVGPAPRAHERPRGDDRGQPPDVAPARALVAPAARRRGAARRGRLHRQRLAHQGPAAAAHGGRRASRGDGRRRQPGDADLGPRGRGARREHPRARGPRSVHDPLGAGGRGRRPHAVARAARARRRGRGQGDQGRRRRRALGHGGAPRRRPAAHDGARDDRARPGQPLVGRLPRAARARRARRSRHRRDRAVQLVGGLPAARGALPPPARDRPPSGRRRVDRRRRRGPAAAPRPHQPRAARPRRHAAGRRARHRGRDERRDRRRGRPPAGGRRAG